MIKGEVKMNDRYAKALERALFNWYYTGDNAPSEPVFNALSEGSKMECSFLFPLKYLKLFYSS